VELVRVGEQPAQFVEVSGFADFFERDGVNFVGRVGKVGVNFDDVGIAHHEQRRIVQGQRIGHQLFQGFAQVAPRGFVFKPEVALLPHIRPTLPGSGAGRTALEAIGFGSNWGWSWHAHEGAQVYEVELITGALFERVVFPLFDELLRCHLHGSLFNRRMVLRMGKYICA
jgi:hypothetical protein